MVDNAILYRVGGGKRPFDDSLVFDVFISAFNLSERVSNTFDRVKSSAKYWVIHNEYGFTPGEIPTNAPLLTSHAGQEADFIVDILSNLASVLRPEMKICVDITGFMRPHLLFLIKYAKLDGWQDMHLVYTEPSHYSRRSETVFSSNVLEVRQINGYEGTHTVDTTSDVLLIGAGYDHDLVSQIIAVKSNARLIQLLSLPSLSADMYQESLLRLQRVADVPHRLPEDQQAYASANDPFSTYIVLEETLRRIRERIGRMGNVYLSPLATKPQAVGFALYYLDYLEQEAASIVFPFAKTYSKETSAGVGRAWIYKLSFHENNDTDSMVAKSG